MRAVWETPFCTACAHDAASPTVFGSLSLWAMTPPLALEFSHLSPRLGLFAIEAWCCTFADKAKIGLRKVVFEWCPAVSGRRSASPSGSWSRHLSSQLSISVQSVYCLLGRFVVEQCPVAFWQKSASPWANQSPPTSSHSPARAHSCSTSGHLHHWTSTLPPHSTRPPSRQGQL